MVRKWKWYMLTRGGVFRLRVEESRGSYRASGLGFRVQGLGGVEGSSAFGRRV